MYLQSHIYKNIAVSFDFITTWNQGVFLCTPCILESNLKLKWLIHRPLHDLQERNELSYLKYSNPYGSNVESDATAPSGVPGPMYSSNRQVI